MNAMKETAGLELHPIIGGEVVERALTHSVPDRHTGAEFASCSMASGGDIARALEVGSAAAGACRAMPAVERAKVLDHLAAFARRERDRLAELLIAEAGKTVTDARGEADRTVVTLELCAGLAREFPASHSGAVQGDAASAGLGTGVTWTREPRGLCSLITPFNFPSNLVAHKIGPAIAAGNPFVLKPADKAPASAYALVEALLETDWPRGGVSCLLAEPGDLDPLIVDKRVRFVSFTGSGPVGWGIKEKAWSKPVALELGGDAPVVVDRGLRDGVLEYAAARIAHGGFYYAGQSCISVQRVIVHREVAEGLVSRLVEKVKGHRAGDPRDEGTFVGPVIDGDAADRIEGWIREAVDAGAEVLVGGGREGNVIEPTVLRGVPRDVSLGCEEVFGPVVVVSEVGSFEEGIELANDSEYGLNAGVFSEDVGNVEFAIGALEYGSVIVNDVPAFRLDAMPYGGVKKAGVGREGPRFAVEEMTEMKTVVRRPLPGRGG